MAAASSFCFSCFRVCLCGESRDYACYWPSSSCSAMPSSSATQLWMGVVVDPEPPAGTIPRAVSMTWTDPCDVEVRVWWLWILRSYTTAMFPGLREAFPGCDVMLRSEDVLRASRLTHRPYSRLAFRLVFSFAHFCKQAPPIKNLEYHP